MFPSNVIGGKRVMASLTRWIDKTLRLTVNERKSAVDRPWNRKFFGLYVEPGTDLPIRGRAVVESQVFWALR